MWADKDKCVCDRRATMLRLKPEPKSIRKVMFVFDIEYMGDEKSFFFLGTMLLRLVRRCLVLV